MSKVLDLTEDVKVVEYLIVKIGEEEYKIPLGGSVTIEELNSFKDINVFQAFLVKNGVPDKYLNVKTVQTLIKAWEDATYEAMGVTPGESSASRGSSKSTARR